MIYVLDSSCLIFMLEKFPKKSCKDLWERFQVSCDEGVSTSSDEVYDYLISVGISLAEKIDWLNKNRKMFKKPTPLECTELKKLLREGIFEYYINSNDVSRNLPIDKPFSIIQAKISGEEAVLVIDKQSMDANKIISICETLNITCIDYDEYLELI